LSAKIISERTSDSVDDLTRIIMIHVCIGWTWVLNVSIAQLLSSLRHHFVTR